MGLMHGTGRLLRQLKSKTVKTKTKTKTRSLQILSYFFIKKIIIILKIEKKNFALFLCSLMSDELYHVPLKIKGQVMMVVDMLMIP